jgi:hypothetical protein
MRLLGGPGTRARRIARIAMWSGPRNISTALMRAFGSRADTAVCDEPLYAHYLAETGAAHPGREEVLAAHDADWKRVVAGLTGPVPGGKSIWYQKHMAHHLLPRVERAWCDELEHAFLIREPREVLLSLDKVTPDPDLAATGLAQQLEIFERERRRSGRVPPVVDAADVLRDPRGTLAALCAALAIPWDEAMLSWEPGPRATDGAWAKHWYAAVERSSGFEPWRPRDEPLPTRLEPLLGECLPIYARLRAQRLNPTDD